ncbi:MAG TPA: sigma-70 family RNA polymerase sigma factor [Stellaceae bacterium]|nr:sigma-70 family RNA polymerase sigma factor [Stellaceae bacterium]
MLNEQAALIETQLPGLRRFARALVRGDGERADDLVQDGIERALAHWHRRRPEGNFRGWLYTIVYNRFVTGEHMRRRHGQIPLAEASEAELPPIDGGQYAALHYRDFLRAFRTLPENQRSVMRLIAVEGLSYQQVARVLGVPIGTVMSRLSRARERLRRHMWGEAGAGRGSSIPAAGSAAAARCPKT